MAALQANGTVTELGIENIQAGVKSEELSFDPRHAGGPHRLDLAVTYDRWIAKMLKAQALKNPPFFSLLCFFIPFFIFRR
jgi:hypothetical protein